VQHLPRTVSGWSGSCSLANSVNVVVVFVVSNDVTEVTLVTSASAPIIIIIIMRKFV